MQGGPPWSRRDTTTTLVLALAALLTRGLLQVPRFVSLDAGLLALGTLEYDFAAYQPHPPYYPLVVAAGKVLALGGDPFVGLTRLSVLSSAAIVACVYGLGRQMAGRGVGLVAAGIVLASPLALANGAVPLSYAAEGAASAALGLAAWQARTASAPRAWRWLGMLLSFAVGLRPSSVLLLAAVALWAAWGNRDGLRRTAISLVVTTLAWLAPTIVLGGGWDAFAYGLRFQSQVFVFAHPVWVDGWVTVGDNIDWLLYNARHAALFAILLAGAGLVAHRRVRAALTPARLAFLGAWLLPGLAFYLFVYGGWPVRPDGYLMAFVAPCAVLAALVLDAVRSAARAQSLPLRVGALALVTVVAALPFAGVLAWPGVLAEANAAREWEAGMADFDDMFPAESSAVLTFYEAPWVKIRHPSHLAYFIELYPDIDHAGVQVEQCQGGVCDKGYFDNIRDGPADAPHMVPDDITRLVVVSDHPGDPGLALLRPGVHATTVRLPEGGEVQVVVLSHPVAIEDLVVLDQPGTPVRIQPPDWGLDSAWNGRASTLRV